jgi:hypothetical protein
MKLARFLAIALLLVLPTHAVSKASRLAIIANDPRLSTEADLLTAELSKRTDLELLEREQILKLRREQSLSAVQGDDYLKFGNLLGADGLLILESPSHSWMASAQRQGELGMAGDLGKWETDASVSILKVQGSGM